MCTMSNKGEFLTAPFKSFHILAGLLAFKMFANPFECDALLNFFRVPEEYRGRRSLELVEALQEHPRNPNRILIGYSRGLIVIWDLINNTATHHFLGNQVLVPLKALDQAQEILSWEIQQD